MAKARKLSPNTHVRSQVRAGVRSGLDAVQIRESIDLRFPNLNKTQVNKVIREEQRRQAAVNDLTTRDKRRNVDLRPIVGCTSPGQQVRASITISYQDDSGIRREYGAAVDLTPTAGRLATILNSAIEQVAQLARGRGYQPPVITSAQTEGKGSTFYRINYIECT